MKGEVAMLRRILHQNVFSTAFIVVVTSVMPAFSQSDVEQRIETWVQQRESDTRSREASRGRLEDDSKILTDIFVGKKTADEVAITHRGRTLEFMGQITGRDTQGDATVVAIENGAAICRFTAVDERLAVSKIGRGCWQWRGTLSRVSGGRLYFENCSFRACEASGTSGRGREPSNLVKRLSNCAGLAEVAIIQDASDPKSKYIPNAFYLIALDIGVKEGVSDDKLRSLAADNKDRLVEAIRSDKREFISGLSARYRDCRALASNDRVVKELFDHRVQEQIQQDKR